MVVVLLPDAAADPKRGYEKENTGLKLPSSITERDMAESNKGGALNLERICLPCFSSEKSVILADLEMAVFRLQCSQEVPRLHALVFYLYCHFLTGSQFIIQNGKPKADVKWQNNISGSLSVTIVHTRQNIQYPIIFKCYSLAQ